MFKENELEILRPFFEILVDGPNWKRLNAHQTAILLLPGVHQEYRITEGVKLWPNAGKYLWVAGTRGDPAYTREDIIAVTGKDSVDIVCGGFARFTPDQMNWCVSLLKQNPEIKHLIVTTAAYHLPRCVLTLLQALLKAKMQISMTPMPLINPNGDSFSAYGTEDFALEMKKIQEYQGKGDVASLEDWREYLAWRTSLPSP